MGIACTGEQPRQVRAHNVRAGGQRPSVGSAAIRAYDEPEASPAAGLHSRDRVLEDHGLPWADLERLRRPEEQLLPRRGVNRRGPRDDPVQIEQQRLESRQVGGIDA